MSKKRQHLARETEVAFIEKFSHDGRGIARIKGKTTFIQGALPNEKVRFQYTRFKSNFDEGKVESILEASSSRVKPTCPHYALCGGCSLQHLDAKTQIIEKQGLLLDLLAHIGHCKPAQILPPLTSEPWHYRNKARLSVRYVQKKGSTLVGFREKNNPRFITEINECKVMNEKVHKEIPQLRLLIDSFSDPNSIAQIEIAAGDEDIALIFRNLKPLTTTDEITLAQFGQRTNFHLFLQPGGPETVMLFYPNKGEEYLSYTLSQQNLKFLFYPTDFTQINLKLNQSMVELALKLMNLTSTDRVLDLFCGLGNFSLALARYCSLVVGVEGSAEMVKRGQTNAQINNLKNVEFFCGNLDNIETISLLSAYNFTKILLDPPRSGALAIVKQIECFNPQRIVYVSCNPATLARDANILVNEKGYSLSTTGVMDMFPHTTHVESIALFEKG